MRSFSISVFLIFTYFTHSILYLYGIQNPLHYLSLYGFRLMFSYQKKTPWCLFHTYCIVRSYKTGFYKQACIASFYTHPARTQCSNIFSIKIPYPHGRVNYQYMGHSPNYFSILNNRAAAHACVK